MKKNKDTLSLSNIKPSHQRSISSSLTETESLRRLSINQNQENKDKENTDDNLINTTNSTALLSTNTHNDSNITGVKVVCRFRPMNDKEKHHSMSSCVNDDFLGLCVKFVSKSEVQIKSSLENNKYNFTFDRIFNPSNTQEEIFYDSAFQIVDSVLQGFNGSILAYGQTGSGKTYTMSGVYDDIETMGIIPRSINHIFNHILSSPEEIEYTVKVSVIEIYLEKIKDLIDTQKTNLNIREDKFGKVYIEELSEHYIATTEEILELMKIGQSNRTVASTNMNEASSRSHSITIITVNQNNTKEISAKSGKLFLVDLAGSEKISKTGVTGLNLDEAKNINKSLTTLGMVINSLTDGKSTHVPYRESKLTRILSESLGGNSKTCLIITCSPANYNDAESLSTMRFGMRAKNIKNKPKINKEFTIPELKLIIEKLENSLNYANIKIKNLEKLIEENRESKDEIDNKNSNTLLTINYNAKTPSKSTKVRSIIENNSSNTLLECNIINETSDLGKLYNELNKKYNDLLTKYNQVEEDKNGLFDKLSELTYFKEEELSIKAINKIIKCDEFSLNCVYKSCHPYQLVYFKENTFHDCEIADISYLDNEVYYILKYNDETCILSQEEFKESCRIKLVPERDIENDTVKQLKSKSLVIDNILEGIDKKQSFVCNNQAYLYLKEIVSNDKNLKEHLNFISDLSEEELTFQGIYYDRNEANKQQQIKVNQVNKTLFINQVNNFFLKNKLKTMNEVESFGFEIYKLNTLNSYSIEPVINFTIYVYEKSLIDYNHDSLALCANTEPYDDNFDHANNTVDIEQYYNNYHDSQVNIYDNVVTFNINQLELISINNEKRYIIKNDNNKDLLDQIEKTKLSTINTFNPKFNMSLLEKESFSIHINDLNNVFRSLSSDKLSSTRNNKNFYTLASDDIFKILLTNEADYRKAINCLNNLFNPPSFNISSLSLSCLKIKKPLLRVKDEIIINISSSNKKELLISSCSFFLAANIDKNQLQIKELHENPLIKEKLNQINEEKEKMKKDKKKFDQEKKLIIKSLEEKMEKLKLYDKENKELKENIKLLNSSLSLDEKQAMNKLYSLEKSFENINILYHQAITQKSCLKIENQVLENKIKKRDEKVELCKKEIDELKEALRLSNNKLEYARNSIYTKTFSTNSSNLVKVIKGHGNKFSNRESLIMNKFSTPQVGLKESKEFETEINI